MRAGRSSTLAAVALAAMVVAVLVAPAAAPQEPRRVAAPASGRMAFTFVGVIDQNGPLAVDVGYLTAVAGLDEEQLFTGTDPLARDESSARFTYFASARLERRSVNGNLFVTGGTAETRLFFQEDGGADFDDPTSFRRGVEIARFESEWHDIVNVQAPDEGIARVESDDTQRSATPFEFDGASLTFGRPDAFLRLSFTGQGTRSQPEPPRAVILYGGEATAMGEAGAGAPGDAPATGGTETSGWVWVGLAAALAALVLSVASLALSARRRPSP